jgi:hypothetical protein
VATSPEPVPQPALPKPATQQPAPPPAAPGVNSKTPVRGGWVIQVGAYRNEQAAKERLSLVQSKASLMLTGAEAFTDSIEKEGTTLYRARFAGLDRDRAEWACEYLKLNDVECVVVKSKERIEPGSQAGPGHLGARPAPNSANTSKTPAASAEVPAQYAGYGVASPARTVRGITAAGTPPARILAKSVAMASTFSRRAIAALMPSRGPPRVIDCA